LPNPLLPFFVFSGVVGGQWQGPEGELLPPVTEVSSYW
jgi:hypothetical protein